MQNQPNSGYAGAPPSQGYPGGPPPQGYPTTGAQPPQAGYQSGPPPPQGAPAPTAAPGAAPSTPALDKMETVAGYENTRFDGSALPPPAYDPSTRGPPPERRDISNVPTITDEQARDALLHHVSENCCYGSKAAKETVFNDLNSSSAFHYTLETYGESRQTNWAFTPFNGQAIDGPMNGPAPGPWDIPVNPPQKFTNSRVDVEVPHTASVKPCHHCAGIGRVRCEDCHGDGRKHCTWCHGRGHTEVFEDGHHHHRHCHHCEGSGRQSCHQCHGHGQVSCPTCQGHAQLKCYIKMTVVWTNHVSDHIVERTALPDELIRGVTGQVAFEEECPRVWPINHFPDQTVNNASNQLVQQHSTSYQSERILLQRQRVRIVPVTQAQAKFHDTPYTFFVYGFENKVYAPEYPQQCCWGCTII